MRSLRALLAAARVGRQALWALGWLTAGSLARAITVILAVPLLVGLAARDPATWWYLLAFTATLGVGAAFDLRASLRAFDVGLGVAANHDTVLLKHVRAAPASWFTPEQRQRLEQMFSSGGTELAQGFAHLLGPLFDALLTTTFIALLVFLVAPGLAWVLALLVALHLAAFAVQVALSRSSERHWFEAAERFSRALGEFSRLQPLLRMAAQDAGTRVAEAVEGQRAASLRLAVSGVAGHQAITLVRVAALLLIPLQIVTSLAAGALTAVEAAALVVVAARFLDPFLQLDRLGATLTSLIAVLSRLDSAFVPPAAAVAAGAAGAARAAAAAPGTAAGRASDVTLAARPGPAAAPAIRFDSVSFTYPGRPTQVVADVSFDVPSGSTLAIVGPSGSGKSTLLALIAGLVEPGAGAISYSGVPREVLGADGVAERTSVVFQSVALVGETILENVAAGDPHATQQQLEEVARAAQLDELIARLPRGWLTPVGEGGGQLSGGERQRVTLARALLKNAPLLLLDEATSSLDTLTEAGFMAALEASRGAQTRVIVAHRLNTIAGADKILFIEGGSVREAGTLGELLDADGRFADYWKQRQVAASWTLA